MSNVTNETANYDTNRITAAVTIVHIIVGTLSVVGNGLVILVAVRSYRKMNQFKWLIVHLAFCDLLFALLILMDLPQWISGKWIYGRVLCKVIPPFLLLSGLAAEGSIIVIACERYRGINNPLAKRWSIKHIILALLMNWVLSFLSISPYINAMSYYIDHDNSTQCVETWGKDIEEHERNSIAYTLFLLVGSFVIPMTIIGVLYGKIIYILRHPKEVSGDEQTCLQMKRRRKKDIRVTKLLVSVIIAFVICVLPNHLGSLIQFMFPLSPTSFTVVVYITLIPYPFHCAVNPIIYSIVDDKFRRDIKAVFCCHKKTLKRKNFSVIYHTRASERQFIAQAYPTFSTWFRRFSVDRGRSSSSLIM